MYFDLALSQPALVPHAHALGFGFCAVNSTLDAVALKKKPPPPVSTQLSTDLSAKKVFSRITVILDDAHASSLNLAAFQAYNILAVQPTSQQSLQLACSKLEIDIISLDFSVRLPFQLRHQIVNAAIQRGIFFEITYSAALSDSNIRRNWIAGVKDLVRVTEGRNLLWGSGAKDHMSLRGVYDVINLGSLFGLNPAISKNCLSLNPRMVLYHAASRQATYKSTITTTPVSALSQTDSWKKGIEENVDFLKLDDLDDDAMMES
ncbi:Ribonuclease P protein subunit p30 [Nowakowskiella sp. JEL0407]|nr:Ribonuclease P protein subunit p30 [Nowakowskiella sp. JEL0407]